MPVGGADTCWAVKTPILYTVESYGKIGGKHLTVEENERAMMAEIHARGPITCSIAAMDDLVYSYRGGIYNDPKNYTLDDVDHDVEVVGWGVEKDGTPYWSIRNSWGAFWGELGFFKLERGTDSLFLESGDCWAAEVGWRMEADVRRGKLVGTMFGVVPADGWVEEEGGGRAGGLAVE